MARALLDDAGPQRRVRVREGVEGGRQRRDVHGSAQGAGQDGSASLAHVERLDRTQRTVHAVSLLSVVHVGVPTARDRSVTAGCPRG